MSAQGPIHCHSLYLRFFPSMSQRGQIYLALLSPGIVKLKGRLISMSSIFVLFVSSYFKMLCQMKHSSSKKMLWPWFVIMMCLQDFLKETLTTSCLGPALSLFSLHINHPIRVQFIYFFIYFSCAQIFHLFRC